MKLVSENREALDERSFKELRRKLTPKGREAWDAIEAVALEKRPTTHLPYRALLFVRNKVVFHYDAEEISAAFRDRFGDGALKAHPDQPLLSRGNTMQETRFYFADAAGLRYMEKNTLSEEARQFSEEGGGEFLEQVNQALHEVIGFPAHRGRGYRRPSEGPVNG